MTIPAGGHERDYRTYRDPWTVGQAGIATGEAAPSSASDGIACPGKRWVSLRVASMVDVTDYDVALYVYSGAEGSESWTRVKGTEIVDETAPISVRYRLDGEVLRFDWVFPTVADGGSPALAWEYKLG